MCCCEIKHAHGAQKTYVVELITIVNVTIKFQLDCELQ